MRVIARDVNMTPIHEIDMYTSIIWTDRYASAGDFELRIPCTSDYYDLFKVAKYITIDKSDRVMVIEKKHLTTKVDNANEYIISGRSAEVLLNRRVIMGTVSYGSSPYDEETNTTASQTYDTGDYMLWYGALYRAIADIQRGDTFVEYKESRGNLATANVVKVTNPDETYALTEPIDTIIASLLNINVINPSDKTRRFVNPTWRYIKSTDPRIQEIKMTASFANTNLFDAVSSLLVGAGLGCKVVYNEDLNTFDYSLFMGVDHSVSQSDNEIICFKPVLDNLVSSEFETDETNYKTCAYVVGDIDDKKTVSYSYRDASGVIRQVDYDNPNYCTIWSQQVSLSGTGMSYQRREVIVDASDISRYQTVNSSAGSTSNDIAITEVDYRGMLKTRGKTELMKMYSTYDMSAEILPDIFYKYMEDYGLGDTISIQNEYGNMVNATVTELIYYVDVNGYKAYPTIEPIGGVDGMDQLINIFVNNPIYVNVDNKMVIPDIRTDLEELRENTFIASYTRDIIDYFLNGHLIYVTHLGGEYTIVVPELDDMDVVVLGDNIGSIYANPAAYPDANTKAMQFIQFMMTNSIYISGTEVIIPSMDELASFVQ